ncbi:NAD(P)-dependent malic enzyme [Proteiniclasticum ruminis]|uniref:Malate dehydrogenase (Oxaloacetate-decarboxylating) n=1 Tax=Proteiniclasticum ruminis TaxID=398199 RepID=A0A1I5BUA0_9CLOT|nr:NADP-dependent malic enzyme [Proteiniclasticum ruminis]SFN78257.1 malate dehydrogenase (oxaloacetate-decarboxylating) [Proteiniclasticum ruminis]
MGNYYEKALELHEKWKGKISVELKAPLKDKEDLSVAYTPGVAEPCREIAKDRNNAYKYTWKGNIVAVVSDGTAVLGLGDIGPEAALPVMEGKAALFKRFAGVNAIPIVLDTKDPKEIIETVKRMAPTFGGINLEDISAPRCVEIERTLIEELDIPVFHDDQHGTAIVVTAGVMNALKLIGKKKEDVTLVVSGTGAAGSSVIKMLHAYGIRSIYAFNVHGILRKGDMGEYNFLEKELCEITNGEDEPLALSEAMKRADLFVGVSAPKVLTKEMVASMKKDAIVFAMANPEPEISYEDAIEAGARVVGTGRSDFPNQVNNVLAFPGLFKGALQVRAQKITEAMKMAAAEGIASLIEEKDLREDYVIPGAFDERVAEVVADAVARKAVEEGLSRI